MQTPEGEVKKAVKNAFLLWLSHGPLASVLLIVWLASLPVVYFAFKYLRRIPTVVSILIVSAELILTALVTLGCLHVGCAREKAWQVQCTQNLREISVALYAYMQDWDEHLPPASKWMDAAKTHLPSGKVNQVFVCPSAYSPFGYAFNSALNGLPLTQITYPAETVMLFECDTVKQNAHGSLKNLPKTPRHFLDVDIYAFVDGHVQQKRRIFATSLRWKP